MDHENNSEDKIYEMLWDCEYCGTKGLLGKTHRYCPSCGGKQNPDKRYFPEEDQKKEAINYEYVGADKTCPACHTAASAASTHCPGCGSPLEGAAQVKLKEKPQTGENMTAKSKSKSKIGIIIGTTIAVVVGIFTAMALIKEDIDVTAKKHIWRTTVEIEKYNEYEREGECSAVPANATNVQDFGKRKENCRKEKKDRGDGTFTEKEVCDEIHRCQYTVLEWAKYKTEKKFGGLNDKVEYPRVFVTGGECTGCTREGARSLVYRVDFAGKDNKEFSCGYDEPEPWKAIEDGKTYASKVNMFGNLSCDEMVLK